MTTVLALPLEEAIELLEKSGYAVETVEARSLKGVENADSKRVIRAELKEECEVPTIRLVYSEFKTKISID